MPATSSYGPYIVYRFIQLTLVLALAFLTYTQATNAYINTQKAITALSVANNAAVKQHGEAALLAAQAKTELEKARNAAERTKSEADALEAEVEKIQAEAATLRQKAVYAEQKARADAMAINSEFELRKAKAFAAIAELRNIARKEKAAVQQLEANLVQVRQATEQLRRFRRSGMGALFGR